MGLGRVTSEQVDLRGPLEPGILVHERLPVVVAGMAERHIEKFAHRVRLAGCHDVVVGFVLLEHEPHCLDVVACVSVVACRIEVPERDGVLKTQLDARECVRDLAREELESPPLALVVEQDARRRVHPIGLSVVDGGVVAEDLRNAVRRPRVEGRELVLGCFAYLSVHLRRRRLVEADRVVLGAAHDAHRLEHAEHTETGDLGGELGLRPRQLHEADGAEVVDLVRLHLLDRGDQRREVAEVAVDELERGCLVDDHLALRVVLAANEAEHLVALADQELGEESTVLSGNSRDEGSLHRGKLLGFVTVETIPARLELVQELVTPFFLVDLAKSGGGAPQTVERPEESAVGLVLPPHVARPAPARLA